MSELPTIDPLNVANREAEKLRTLVAEGIHRETQLEILAEALRDERDEAIGRLGTANSRITELESAAPTPVADITSLPK